ncbi:MAG: rhodanese-like domain-containing protein [Pseudomonadota bacterium]
MQHITPSELDQWLKDSSRPRPVLLDVREPWEFDICRIDGSLSMPMRAVPVRAGELDPGAETVVICHHGVRSYQVAMFLERQGFGRLYNLGGGVDAWANSVEPTMRKY